MSIQPSKLSNNHNSDSGGLDNLFSSVTQISKSIASNLDLDNLINSTLTLVHQNFGFEKINIYIFEGQENKVLIEYSLSNKSIKQSRKPFQEGDDNGPISWAATHHELIAINDFSKESKFGLSASDSNIKSELVLPLTSGDLIIGILDLYSDDINRFSPNEIDGFQSLSEYLALAIRNAKLFHSEQLRRRISENILEIIADISADTPQAEICSDILTQLDKFIPCQACALWLMENNSSDNGIEQFTSSLKFVALKLSDQYDGKGDQQIRPNIELVKNNLQLEDDGSDIYLKYSWISEVINSQQPLIGSGEKGIEPLGKALSFPDNYSYLGIPLHSDDKSLGIIIAVHRDPDQYTGEYLLPATIYAKSASIAITNVKLFSVAHDQTWLATVLQQSVDTFQSMTSMDELLEALVSMLADIAGANACTIYLWDRSIKTFFSQISYGYDIEQKIRLDEWDVVYGSVPAFDLLVDSKIPVILNNDTVTSAIASLIFPSYDFQSNLLILFPMVVQDNILGAMLIDFSNTKLEKNTTQKVWDDVYVIVQGIAQQASIAIENLLIIKSREEEAYISVALLQVAQAIVSLNQMDEILSSIVRITPILVGVKRCIIYLWNREDLVFETSQYYGFSKSDLQFEGRAIRSNEFPFIEAIFIQNRIAYYQLTADILPISWGNISVEDFHVIESTVAEFADQFTHKLDSEILRENTRLLIGFPLSVTGEVLGVMIIEEEDPIKGPPSQHIREKRIEIVNGITQQAALAIKNEQLRKEVLNNERMERELQLAREIQRTFIPDQLPTFYGWDMDARWEPARQVAGDFYDFMLLDDHLMGFVIADVADKGMPAALFMTLIRTLIRAAAKDNMSPAAVLRQVNDLLINDAKNGMFVTVFYGVLDITSGLFTYANAGHNPPIVKGTHSKDLIELTRTSMALGIFTDIEVEQRNILLRQGDLVLFYTDGVTEAFSINQEMYSIGRLYNLLQDRQFSSMRELLDEIDDSVHMFIDGSELSDDITLAGIYRKFE